jgi:hypothetical protein
MATLRQVSEACAAAQTEFVVTVFTQLALPIVTVFTQLALPTLRQVSEACGFRMADEIEVYCVYTNKTKLTPTKLP